MSDLTLELKTIDITVDLNNGPTMSANTSAPTVIAVDIKNNPIIEAVITSGPQITAEITSRGPAGPPGPPGSAELSTLTNLEIENLLT